MKFRKLALALVASAAVLSMGACQTGGMVNAEAIDPNLEIVTARHDAYVRADASLTPVERRTALRSSWLLGRLMDTALKRPERPAPPELEGVP